MPSESAIQRDIIACAEAMGAKVYRMNAGRVRVRNGWMRLCEDGTPDLLTVWPHGVSLWVEVKRPGEEPTDAQRSRHRELRALGHAVAVCESTEQFVEAMDEVR